MATAIEDYLENRIDNYALDDALTKLKETEDHACRAIAKEMWFHYDDCSRHRNEGKWKVSTSIEQAAERWFVLLHSDCEWNWTDKQEVPPVRGFRGLLRWFKKVTQGPVLPANEFWPWSSEQDWLRWLGEERKGLA